jgi:hypothetical protein
MVFGLKAKFMAWTVTVAAVVWDAVGLGVSVGEGVGAGVAEAAA